MDKNNNNRITEDENISSPTVYKLSIYTLLYDQFHCHQSHCYEILNCQKV